MADPRAEAGRCRVPAWAWLAPFVVAVALLSIGIDRDWRLVHEDNGALHTTFARSHLDLGLARTRGQDVFFRPETGELSFYGHHPSGTSLALAAAFALAGSDTPRVARTVAITFHLASLLLLMLLLGIHLAPVETLLGGVVFAVIPMSAFFGRMVNYEAPCLTGVLLQLYGYARWRTDRRGGHGFALLALGILLSGLVDWPAFFVAAALGGAEAWRAVHGERDGIRGFVAIALISTAVLVLDLVHLALATGSLDALSAVVGGSQASVTVTPAAFLAREWTHGRRFFGSGAVIASAALLIGIALPGTIVGAELRRSRHAGALVSWLGASFAGALAYTLAAPSWAMVHAYWAFYFLPFVVTAVVIVGATLVRRAAAPGRARLVAAALGLALLVDLALTSVRTLVKRHSTDEEYAVRVTQEFRTEYLPPRSLDVTSVPRSAD